MTAADYEDIVIKASESFRLDVNIIKAICTVESNWQTWKNRYEPAYSYLVSPVEYASRLCISQSTEETNQKISWGMGQVMGGLARELGFLDDLPMLCDPQIGIFYCSKQLRRLSDKHGNEADVVSSYNQGSPRMTSGGMYMNQQYVDKVYAVLRDLRKLV